VALHTVGALHPVTCRSCPKYLLAAFASVTGGEQHCHPNFPHSRVCVQLVVVKIVDMLLQHHLPLPPTLTQKTQSYSVMFPTVRGTAAARFEDDRGHYCTVMLLSFGPSHSYSYFLCVGARDGLSSGSSSPILS
jgi:hypothetical protein